MFVLSLTAAVVGSVPQATPAAAPSLDEGLAFRSRHYEVLDERGAGSARTTAEFLEAAFSAFEDLLRAAPKLKDEARLRVEVFENGTAFHRRLAQLGVTGGVSGDAYDPTDGTAFVQADRMDYRTRAALLRASLRQFHHRAKRKNAELAGHWFVTGLAEAVALHRWDDGQLEICAHLDVSVVDTPARALDAMLHRPASQRVWTPTLLGEPALAWTATTFLLEGEGGKHRKRFQKLALGHRGSMLDGDQVAFGLGSETQLPTIEAWLRSVQLPLEVVRGEFEDLGGGRLRGRGLAQVRPRSEHPTRRIACVLEVGRTPAAGLLLGRTSQNAYTALVLSRQQLWDVQMDKGKRRAVTTPGQPVMRNRVHLEARFEEGMVEIRVDGASLGWTHPAGPELGLIVESDAATFTDVEWD